jgi:cobaltochelatase CobS
MPTAMTCTQCGKTRPGHDSGLCWACRSRQKPAGAPSTETTPLITALMDELEKAGFTPQPDAVTMSQVVAIAESMADQMRVDGDATMRAFVRANVQTIELKAPDKAPKTVDGPCPVWFGRLCTLAACRLPALLVGPAGCGKTTAVQRLAEALELPFHRVSIAAGTDEGQLTGWLHPVGAQMQFQYVPSVVTHAYEHGGVVLIDDLDLGDANALGILNAALDDGGWDLPLRHEQPHLVRHDDFVIAAAANTWGHGADRQFVGANQLDERTLSRFRLGQIPCDYDAALERHLFADDVVRSGHALRQRCRAVPSLHKDVSTRDLASVHRLRSQLSLDEAWYGFFGGWSEAQLAHIDVTLDHERLCAVLE